MKKKLLISAVILVVIIGAAMTYLNYRNRSLSPPGEATLSNYNLDVTISYSRPSKKGRVIFGTEEEGALQPYGKYWRLGANESTEITFSKNVVFNGQPIAKGTYKMYTFPGPEFFEIRLNTDLGEWGAFEPDYENDILKTQVAVNALPLPIEQFTIDLLSGTKGVIIAIKWDNVLLSIPVAVDE